MECPSAAQRLVLPEHHVRGQSLQLDHLQKQDGEVTCLSLISGLWCRHLLSLSSS